MKVLVAKNTNDNGFQKVGVYNVRLNGTVSLPMKFNGQLEGRFIRDGAKALTNNSAINYLDFQFGTSPTYRVCRM